MLKQAEIQRFHEETTQGTPRGTIRLHGMSLE